MIATLGTAIVVFVATNIDEVLLLVALFGSPLKARAVVAGQFVGIAVLTAVSAGAAFAATAIPAQWIQWLGILPIAMGLWLLWQLWRHRGQGGVDDDDDLESERRFEARLHSQVLAVAAVTIANGGDNLSVYIPVFAKDVSVLPLYIGVFAVLTAVWCWMAHALVRHPVVGAVMTRWGHVLLPFVLIAIGVKVLW